MALALSAATGWPLVALEATDGEILHVCVRREDGCLVDVRGAHATPQDLAAARARPIERAELEELVNSGGWAPPATDEAARLVESVLARGRAEPEEALKPAVLRVSRRVDDHELVYEWAGEDTITVWVRGVGTEPWSFYAYIVRRSDEREPLVIDFDIETLVYFADNHRFDAGRADAQIAKSQPATSGVAAGRSGPGS